MIDELEGVWLIEVNTNPCLDLSSPLLEELIPRMLDDAFRLTIDSAFDPGPLDYLPLTLVPDTGNGNLWELICKIN
jgi:hypothetical protein